MENNTILKAEDLSFSYRGKGQRVDAVKNVTCGFETGLCYAIVGKSGSGKTTLLSLLAGLETPTGGSVKFRGQSTEKMDRDVYRRDHVAVIYQNYNLFPLLTAEENVQYSMKLKGVSRADAKSRARQELLKVGIDESQFRRFPSRLSGGEQQRVAIARALAAGNPIILADEPTGNLDITNGDQVVAILLKLAHEEGRCVVIVTHDLDIASQADVIYTMRDGVLEYGE